MKPLLAARWFTITALSGLRRLTVQEKRRRLVVSNVNLTGNFFRRRRTAVLTGTTVQSCSLVAGAAIIFAVQRSSRSKARKEELRKQEIQAISMRNEELEQHARGRGLLSTLNIKHTQVSVDRKSN